MSIPFLKGENKLHRLGGVKGYSENTLTALKDALKNKLQQDEDSYWEFDVGEAINSLRVFHDWAHKDISRMVKPNPDIPRFVKLQNLDSDDIDLLELRNGDKIPTVAEVLGDLTGKVTRPVCIEIKYMYSTEGVNALIALAKNFRINNPNVETYFMMRGKRFRSVFKNKEFKKHILKQMEVNNFRFKH